jgi:hypothetical protein
VKEKINTRKRERKTRIKTRKIEGKIGGNKDAG